MITNVSVGCVYIRCLILEILSFNVWNAMTLNVFPDMLLHSPPPIPPIKFRERFLPIYRVAQKERMFLNPPAISFFGTISNQKSTFENLGTVDDLKVSIREEIATVPQEMLVNVMQNFEERLRTCVRQKGHHLSDIIFCN